ncbi:MAG: DUF4175 family protein [Ignavibacteria bacterium]|nr:DUF4175 family protein [Ignavibacteria bacterium]
MSNGILNTDIIYNEFEEKLKKVNIRQLNFTFLKFALYIHLIFIVLAFLIICAGVFINFNSTARTFLFWGTTGTFIASIIFLFLYYSNGVFKPFDLIGFSKKIGMNYPDVKDNISNSLSVYNEAKTSKGKELYSNELVYAGIYSIKNKYYEKNLTSHISFGQIKRLFFKLLAAVIIIVLSFAVFPGSLKSSLNKFLNYNYEYINDTDGILFEFEPGDVKVLKGGSLVISVKIKSTNENFIADSLNLFFETYSYDNELIQTANAYLAPISGNHFVYTLENINSELTYYAVFKGIKSKKYNITLIEYPVVKNFKVKVTPPAYTSRLPFELNENEGNIICPEGSKIEFELKSNKLLTSAGIELNNNYIAFSAGGDSARGSFNAVSGGTYSFVLKDSEGSVNKEDKLYELKVISDAPPQIYIIEPKETDYFIHGEKEVLIRARISDDYGFSSLTIHFRKTSANTTASGVLFTPLDIPVINKDATALEVPFTWDISFFRLSKGESVEYYLEVKDNGGKTARTEIRYIKYISPAESLKKLESFIKDVRSNLKAILEDIKNFKREASELEKKLQNTEELGINEQKRKEFQEKLERLQSNLDDAQNKMGNTLEELKQSPTLSSETLEEFMKLQEQFNKINTPEFREMLKKMLEALKKNDMRQFQDELKNMNFDEEAFKKQLEKLLELMKKIENLQRFGELTQKLDELTKEQGELKEETEKSEKSDNAKINDLSDKQKGISEKFKKWKDELDKLIENMKNTKEEMSTADLEALKQKMNSRNTESKMNKSSDQLRRGEKDESEMTQEDIMEDLNEYGEEMMDALDNAMNSDDKMQKMLNKLKEIKQSIDKLSREQGELTSKTKGTDPGNQSDMNRRSGEQKGLEYELSQDINDLYNLSREGLEIKPELGKELGNAYNKMEKAGNELRERKKNEAIPNQQEAKESLDKSSEMLGDMISQLSKQSKGGKPGNSSRMSALMQKLAMMIQMQQGMNNQMQKFGKNGKVGQDGKDGQDTDEQRKDEIDKLRLQQEQNRKTLEELNAEIMKEMKKRGEKPLGDLDEIAEDMQKIERDLEQYKINEETLQRQNKIISRLLEFQLSQREKDFEQKRESNPGENIIRLSPPEIVISGPNSINALQEDFLRLKQEGYTEAYEQLIMKYLESIKK